MRISAGTGVSGDHEDGADRAVLGQQTSSLSAGGKSDDGAGVDVQRGADSSHGARLDNADGALNEGAELLEVLEVGNGVLGLQTGVGHLADGFLGVVALGSLSRKHDAVGTVGNSVTHVADLGTGRAGVVDHGLEHLSGTDDGLTGHVAHGNHLLLRSKDLSCGNLNSEITTSNHDTVSLLQNLGKVVETLTVLDLGDDLDVLAVLAENLADGLDIITSADERGENHIHVVLDTKSEIGLVLLGQSGEVHIGVGEVDSLLGGDLAVVAGTAADGLSILDLEDVKGKNTVINVDDAARLDDLGDVLVVNVPERGNGQRVS